MHEIIHALGYTHMHNHADRDKYVKIFWNNIKPSEKHNFDKIENLQYSNYNTTYDYYSIMHYDLDNFAINPKLATIYPLDIKYKNIIGKQTMISIGDARRINRMYNCKDVKYN
jgi:hypothetical protein